MSIKELEDKLKSIEKKYEENVSKMPKALAEKYKTVFERCKKSIEKYHDNSKQALDEMAAINKMLEEKLKDITDPDFAEVMRGFVQKKLETFTKKIEELGKTLVEEMTPMLNDAEKMLDELISTLELQERMKKISSDREAFFNGLDGSLAQIVEKKEKGEITDAEARAALGGLLGSIAGQFAGMSMDEDVPPLGRMLAMQMQLITGGVASKLADVAAEPQSASEAVAPAIAAPEASAAAPLASAESAEKEKAAISKP